MIRVERGNVVLHVMDEEKRHYMQMGYNVTDEMGNVIEAAVPRDMGTLQQFYIEGQRKIAELEAQITELQNANKIDIVEQIKAEEAAKEEKAEKTPAKRGRKKAE